MSGYFVVIGIRTGDTNRTIEYLLKRPKLAKDVIQDYLHECFDINDLIDAVAEGRAAGWTQKALLLDALTLIQSWDDEDLELGGVYWHEDEDEVSYNRKSQARNNSPRKAAKKAPAKKKTAKPAAKRTAAKKTIRRK